MKKQFRVVLPALLLLHVLSEMAVAQAASCGQVSANDGGFVDRTVLTTEFESLIEGFIRESALLPGVAIGIVWKGKVVLALGYGFRDLSNCSRVSPDTRFYLKSTTKSFSGMVAAILHEKDAISLDAPITDYLPDLSVPAPLNPNQISLADHFTHTQPYRAGGLNYRTAFPGNLDEAEFVDHIDEFGSPRDILFRYSNEGPIIGMYAIGTYLGETWQELIQQEIFDRVGMPDSFTRMSEAERGPMAKSYYLADDRSFNETKTKSDRQMNAAGGAVSTVNDLNRWVLLNLAGGRLDGEQVIAQRAVEHAHSRIVYLDTRFAEFDRFAYGLGLYSADYDGDVLLHHFGGETHVSFMPDQQVGVVILTNAIANGGVATHRLAASIYDLLLNKADANQKIAQRLIDIDDWIRQSELERAEYLAGLNDHSSRGQSSLAAGEIAGTYVDPRLGSISITVQGGELSGDFGEIEISIRHIGGDFFAADFGLWGDLPELFRIAKNERGQLVLDWGGRLFVRHSG